MNILTINNRTLNLSNHIIIARIMKSFMETDLNNLYRDLYDPNYGPMLRLYSCNRSPKEALRLLYGKQPCDPFTPNDIFSSLMTSIYCNSVDDEDLTETMKHFSELDTEYPDVSHKRSFSLEYYQMLYCITVEDYYSFIESVSGDPREREIKRTLYEFAESCHPEFKRQRHTHGKPLYLGEVLSMAREVLSSRMWADINLFGEDLDIYNLIYKDAKRAVMDILLFPFDECFTPAPNVVCTSKFSRYIMAPDEFEVFLDRTSGGIAV